MVLASDEASGLYQKCQEARQHINHEINPANLQAPEVD